MTAHEALSALAYLVTGGYALYLGWFLIGSILDAPKATQNPRSEAEDDESEANDSNPAYAQVGRGFTNTDTDRTRSQQ